MAVQQQLAVVRSQGGSYKVAAKAIATLPEFDRKRAKTVAVTEMAAAYEIGKTQPTKLLSGLGFSMQKSWLLLGDSKVCEKCLENQASGWIPADETFTYGEQPPAHPNCRCSADYRMAPGAALPAPPPVPAAVQGFREFQGDDGDVWGYGPKAAPQYTPEGALILRTGLAVGDETTAGAYGEWAQSVSDDESLALSWYASDGYDYMNKFLTGGVEDRDLGFLAMEHGLADDGEALDWLEAQVALAREAVSRGVVPEDIVTWRGAAGSWVKGVNVGDVIEHPTLVSTTLRQEKAVDFAAAQQPSGSADPADIVVYKVLAPKGTKGAYLGARFGILEEQELLLPPGGRWEVVADEVVVFDSENFGPVDARQLTVRALAEDEKPAWEVEMEAEEKRVKAMNDTELASELARANEIGDTAFIELLTMEMHGRKS